MPKSRKRSRKASRKPKRARRLTDAERLFQALTVRYEGATGVTYDCVRDVDIESGELVSFNAFFEGKETKLMSFAITSASILRQIFPSSHKDLFILPRERCGQRDLYVVENIEEGDIKDSGALPVSLLKAIKTLTEKNYGVFSLGLWKQTKMVSPLLEKENFVMTLKYLQNYDPNGTFEKVYFVDDDDNDVMKRKLVTAIDTEIALSSATADSP
jgi:hypothetical protein